MAVPQIGLPDLSETARLVASLPPGGHQPKPSSYYFSQLERTGKTTIPCPHGMGKYHISINGCFWYDTAEIIFEANDKAVAQGYGTTYAPSFARTNRGRAIPWYPKWNGYFYKGARIDGMTENEARLQQAKMLVGYVLTGRRLYKLRCGQGISSLNDDYELG